MRKRQIVKVGGSCDIRLSPSDIEDFELKEGDFVNIEDISKVKDEK